MWDTVVGRGNSYYKSSKTKGALTMFQETSVAGAQHLRGEL